MEKIMNYFLLIKKYQLNVREKRSSADWIKININIEINVNLGVIIFLCLLFF